MKFRNLSWWGMAVLLSAALIAVSGCSTDNKPLVKVGDQTITKKQYLDELDRMYGRDVMDRLVADSINEQYAKKIGAMPTEEEIKAETEVAKKAAPNLDMNLRKAKRTMEDWRIEVRREMIQRRIITKGVKVSPASVKKFYDEMMALKQAPFYTYGTITLVIMPLPSKEIADKASRALRDGAGWEQVAKKYLDNEPQALASAGQALPLQYDDAGMFTVGRNQQNQPQRMQPFPEPYNTQILKIPTGGISTPINYGGQNVWIVVKVADKTAARKLSFADGKYLAQTQVEMQEAGVRQGGYTGKSAEQAKGLQKFKEAIKIQPSPSEDRWGYLKNAGKEAAASDKKTP